MAGGQQFTTGQGSSSGSTFVGLKSRKIPQAGAIERALTGTALTSSTGTMLIARTKALSGSSITSGTGLANGPPGVPASFSQSPLRYSGYVSTTPGYPSALIDYSKHTQWEYMNGKIYAYGGDLEGQLIMPLENYVPIGASGATMVTPVSYDFANGGQMTQLMSGYGVPADLTAPYRHDGATFCAVPSENMFVCLPGQQADYGVSGGGYDPNNIMGTHIGHVHYLRNIAGVWKWTVGPFVRYAGGWPGEHFGGAYHEGTRSVWMQYNIGTTYGGLKRFNIDTEVITQMGHFRTTGNFPDYGDIGPELVTREWPQVVLGDELICYDGYRGKIVSINLLDAANSIATPEVRAEVPPIVGSVLEPAGSVEMSLAVSESLNKVYLSTSAPQYFANNQAGVYEIHIPTGRVSFTEWPVELTNPIHKSFTESAFDDVNKVLVNAGNANNRVWGKRLVLYDYSLPWLGAVNEWVDIPNSIMLPLAPGRPQTSHMTALGYGPIVTGNEVMPFMDPNKNGITPTLGDGSPAGLGGRTWNQLKLNYGGVANDNGLHNGRPANILVNWGDSGWPDSTVHRFVDGVSSPYWEVAAVGSHRSMYKNDPPAEGFERNMQPGDDTRYWVNLDGKPRGGHQYWENYCVSRYDWHFTASHHQMHPTDSAHAFKVTIGDMSAGAWLTTEPVGHPLHTAGVQEPFRCQDALSEDIYMFQGEWLDIWRAATNTYSYFRVRNDGYTIDDAVGAYNYTDSYLLFCYEDASIPGDRAVVNKNHWSVFTGSAIEEISSHTGPFASVASYVTTDAPIGSRPRVCGMQWVPPWNKFAFFRDDGYIYTIQRISSTTLYWDRLVATGSAPVVSSSAARNGSPQSVYTNFWYVDNPSCPQKYLRWSQTDHTVIKALRVV